MSDGGNVEVTVLDSGIVITPWGEFAVSDARRGSHFYVNGEPVAAITFGLVSLDSINRLTTFGLQEQTTQSLDDTNVVPIKRSKP